MNKESFAVIIRRNRWREMRATINLYTTEGWSLISLTRSDGDALILFERDTL
jgi:hypothetical protein